MMAIIKRSLSAKRKIIYYSFQRNQASIQFDAIFENMLVEECSSKEFFFLRK